MIGIGLEINRIEAADVVVVVVVVVDDDDDDTDSSDTSRNSNRCQ